MKSLSEPGRKISRQFEALAHYEREGFAYPLTAEIDLTWRCALNCKGCHSKWLHQDQELSGEDLTRVLGQLLQHGCKSVTWSGGGDPLESPIWKQAMAWAFEYGFKQGLYSYMPEPSQSKIDYIETFCDFVYSHPFKTDGLKRRRGLPFTNEPRTWTAGFLLDKDNWTRYPRMIDSVDLSFFDYVDFRPLCPTNEPNPKSLDYSWIPSFIESFECSEFRNNKQVTLAEYKFLDLLKPDGGRNYGACYSTDFVCVVGPNGDVFECINRRGFSDSVLGNLLREDLSEIWKRKSHCRTDFTGCRVLCRSHELNKTLYQILGPAPRHEEFI